MSGTELQIARDAYNVGEFDRAIGLCRSGIREAEPRNEQIETALFRILLSRCFWVKGEYQEALSLTALPELTGALDADTKARLLNQRGFAYSQLGNFAEARRSVEEAQRLAASSGLDTTIGLIEITRGTLFFYLCDYEAVEACGKTALAIAEKAGAGNLEGSASATIGKSFMYRQRWTEAVHWFERAVAVFAREGCDYYAMCMRADLGACHFALHEDDKTEQLFSQALENSRETGALARYHIDLANMGCLHLRRGEYAAALDHFQKAVEIARRLGDSISTAKWLRNLVLTYSRMGNLDLAKSCEVEAERVQQRVAQARAAASA